VRRAVPALAALLAFASAGCGAPARARTHGYRAHVTLKDGSAASGEFEIAVRGDDRRKEPPLGKPGPVLIWRGGEKRLLELDPASREYRERPFGSLDDALPGHPLAPGFSERSEALRRGVESYHRESDSVFAGHVCWIWRYDDKPGDPSSPSTSYWVAPDLDGLVLRVVREAMQGGELKRLSSSDLTDVRVGADPSLFTPQDFKKVDAPTRPHAGTAGAPEKGGRATGE
jgi:hypothetical protein